MPVKPLLAGLVVAAPTFVVTLLYAMNQQADVSLKQEQIRIEAKIDNAKFDRNLANAYKGLDISAPTDAEIAALEKKAADIEVKRADFDERNRQNRQDLQDALDSAGSEPQDPATQARVMQLLKAQQSAKGQ